MPDLLHQIKKGVWPQLLTCYESLLLKLFDIWIANTYLDEMDKRFTLVPRFQGIKQFQCGIRNLPHMTAGEYGDIIKVADQYTVITTDFQSYYSTLPNLIIYLDIFTLCSRIF